MIKAGIIGATGYNGIELLRLLVAHSEVELCYASTEYYVGKNLSDTYPHLRNKTAHLVGEAFDLEKVISEEEIEKAVGILESALP